MFCCRFTEKNEIQELDVHELLNNYRISRKDAENTGRNVTNQTNHLSDTNH